MAAGLSAVSRPKNEMNANTNFTKRLPILTPKSVVPEPSYFGVTVAIRQPNMLIRANDQQLASLNGQFTKRYMENRHFVHN